MAFDREAAKAEGYTDEEIDAYLNPAPPVQQPPKDRSEENTGAAQAAALGLGGGALDLAKEAIKYGAPAYGLYKGGQAIANRLPPTPTPTGPIGVPTTTYPPSAPSGNPAVNIPINQPIAPGTATTFTATQTFNGTSSTASLKETNIIEPASVSGTAPTATTNFYINSGAVQYITANNANNWTLNFAFSSGTSLNSAMTTNDSLSCTLITTNTTTAYYPSAFTIDGTSVTPKWQGGTAPTSGNASSIDSYTFVIIKTGSAVYTVLASQTKFA